MIRDEVGQLVTVEAAVHLDHPDAQPLRLRHSVRRYQFVPRPPVAEGSLGSLTLARRRWHVAAG